MSALLATLAVLLGIGVVGLAAGAEQRRADRMPVLTREEPAPAPLTMSLRGEIWAERQFPVLWLDVGSDPDPSVLPPGLERLPEPGTVVASPGLVESGAVDGLGLVTSPVGTGPDGTIGPEGLAVPSEWLAYARPPAGRSLGTGGALISVVGFGPGPHDPTITFETDPAAPSLAAALFTSGWLFLLPALVLAASAAAALSPLRTRRLHLLHRFGLTGVQLRALAAVETSALAGVGVLGALAGWVLVAPRLSDLPFSGIALPPGGLAIPPALVGGAAVGALVLFAVLGALTTGVGRSSSARSSSRRPAASVSAWKLTPLVLAGLLLLLSRLLGAQSGAPLIWASLLVLLAGIPVALPWLVQRFGSRLAASRNAPRWLAGQRLRFSPTALARPAVAIAALVFVAGALTGIHQRFTASAALEGPPGTMYLLDWRDSRPGDAELVADLLAPASVIPLHQAEGETPRAYLPTCQAVLPVIGGPAARACVNGELSAGAAQAWQDATSSVPVLGAPPELPAGSVQTVLITGDPTPTDSAVWRAVNPTLSAVNLSVLGAQALAPPLAQQWLLAASSVGLLLLLLAFLQSYGNRVLAVVDEDRRLIRVALSAGEVRAVQRWTLAGPLLIAAPTGFVCATVFLVAANDLELAVTATGWVLVETLVCGLTSALVALGLARLQRSWLS
ncbi:hypothetical protein [Blastococcus sp. LR1]|uniref:hypothetical protein n=1 Tax=Blastococcus sp. LR1 TaxID=2877000 RepID=UPI001CC999A8|nr:hypothetical protein [Blastococcus sp. LR1]MCA0145674.1 hypothetical protein [Blastococcus sp. LR1]